MKYREYITSRLELSEELKKAVDDYKAKKISAAELEETVHYYALKFPDKMFDGDGIELNKSVRFILGKRRESTINVILKDLQMSFNIAR